MNSMLKPFLGVEIINPTQKELDKYYQDTGEMKISSSSQNSPREFKKAKIKKTFNNKKFPIDSVWMMGESPGIKVNFFGKKIIIIQKRDLYERIS